MTQKIYQWIQIWLIAMGLWFKTRVRLFFKIMKTWFKEINKNGGGSSSYSRPKWNQETDFGFDSSKNNKNHDFGSENQS